MAAAAREARDAAEEVKEEADKDGDRRRRHGQHLVYRMDKSIWDRFRATLRDSGTPARQTFHWRGRTQPPISVCSQRMHVNPQTRLWPQNPSSARFRFSRGPEPFLTIECRSGMNLTSAANPRAVPVRWRRRTVLSSSTIGSRSVSTSSKPVAHTVSEPFIWTGGLTPQTCHPRTADILSDIGKAIRSWSTPLGSTSVCGSITSEFPRPTNFT